METLLEEGLNEMGIGPQGLTGSASVMGVNIESSARHPQPLALPCRPDAGRIGADVSASMPICPTKFSRTKEPS